MGLQDFLCNCLPFYVIRTQGFYWKHINMVVQRRPVPVMHSQDELSSQKHTLRHILRRSLVLRAAIRQYLISGVQRRTDGFWDGTGRQTSRGTHGMSILTRSCKRQCNVLVVIGETNITAMGCSPVYRIKDTWVICVADGKKLPVNGGILAIWWNSTR